MLCKNPKLLCKYLHTKNCDIILHPEKERNIKDENAKRSIKSEKRSTRRENLGAAQTIHSEKEKKEKGKTFEDPFPLFNFLKE